LYIHFHFSIGTREELPPRRNVYDNKEFRLLEMELEIELLKLLEKFE